MPTSFSAEVEFWKNDPVERPGEFRLENFFNKAVEFPRFYNELRRFYSDFQKAQRILELGGGQGWAACIVKRLFPKAHVTATDISPWAVESQHHWERLFEVKLDASKACSSFYTQFPDQSFDLVFAFEAAHHFQKHGRTFEELFRILKPSGKILYLFEPLCNSFWHPLAKWRVNRKRPIVPEDVLIFERILALARDAGFQARLEFRPVYLHRGLFETFYYLLLAKIPLLSRWLPCTGNMIFEKPYLSPKC